MDNESNNMEKNSNPDFKSGFVAIAGAPNAGKSTLLNRMLGEKISITSKKPQTTRNRILGIANRASSQLVFLDTPGIHKARTALNTRIVDIAVSTLSDADIILAVIDVSKPDPQSEKVLIKKIASQKRPVVLALNKIDIVKKPFLLQAIESWMKTLTFKEIVPVSAKHGTQVEQLFEAIETLLPKSPPFFPDESITTLPERFIAAEIIREKAFRLTGQEIPYSVAVTIDSFKEKNKGALITISATIHVERESQKGIIIGKKGSKLKAIGEDARRDLERMTGTKIFLKLFVRVQKNWSNDTKALRRFGY